MAKEPNKVAPKVETQEDRRVAAAASAPSVSAADAPAPDDLSGVRPNVAPGTGGDPDAEPRTDNYDKAPGTPVPNDMVSHDPSKAPRQTNLDPLGTGLPTTAVADPMDNRAIGKQSDVAVISDNRLVGEERPEYSPSFAGMVITAGGVTSTEDARAMGYLDAAPVLGRKVDYVDGARVKLLKPHYLNDVYYDAGAIIEAYSGPVSKDMQPVDERGNPA